MKKQERRYWEQDWMLGGPLLFRKPEQRWTPRTRVTIPEYQTPCKHKQSPNCLRQRCLEARKIPYQVEDTK